MTQSITKLRELGLTIVRKEGRVALEKEEKLFFLPVLGSQQYKQKTLWTVFSVWCQSTRVLPIQALSFHQHRALFYVCLYPESHCWQSLTEGLA